MSLTIANEMRKAALDGMLALLNSGQFRLTSAANGGGSELANLTFGGTAFGASTTANPSVATSNAITADSSVTPGTVLGFDLRTSGGVSRINGTVGVGSGDFQVSDNVIPGAATVVSCDAGLQLSLTLG